MIIISELEENMYKAAKDLDFEQASIYRDQIMELKAKYKIK